jgi:hypothetical protein
MERFNSFLADDLASPHHVGSYGWISWPGAPDHGSFPTRIIFQSAASQFDFRPKISVA